MLDILLQTLSTDLALHVCLRIVGYLRRIAVFSELELRVQFLQARDSFLVKVLALSTCDHTSIRKHTHAYTPDFDCLLSFISA